MIGTNEQKSIYVYGTIYIVSFLLALYQGYLLACHGDGVHFYACVAIGSKGGVGRGDGRVMIAEPILLCLEKPKNTFSNSNLVQIPKQFQIQNPVQIQNTFKFKSFPKISVGIAIGIHQTMRPS